MMTSDVNAFLAHHGVKGMRWGIRKKSVSVNAGGAHDVLTISRTGKIEKIDRTYNLSRDAKVHEVASRPVSALTNKQLRDYNNRIALERQYAQLNHQPGFKEQVDKGHNYVKDVVAIGLTVVALNKLKVQVTGKGFLPKAAEKAGKEADAADTLKKVADAVAGK